MRLAGVDMNAVRINLRPEDGCFCILYDGETTECFYFERGIDFGHRRFTERALAMGYFQRWVQDNLLGGSQPSLMSPDEDTP